MNKLFWLVIIPFTIYAQDFAFNKETGKAVPNFVAELKVMKGSVMKTTGGRPQPVQTGEKFYPKDVVTTDADSSMKILVADDTWLSLGPESELEFTQFEFRDKNDRKIHYELKKGQLAANVRQSVKKGEVIFRSRYTSMGVRGTKILMNYREINGQGISEYALLEGKAEVITNTGTSYELNSGERIVLIEDPKKKETSLEKLDLTKEDLDKFASPEGEEEKDIRPFMPYYGPKAVTVTKAETGKISDQSKSEKNTTGDGTFNNLKKLNEQLQDNQKKRR